MAVAMLTPQPARLINHVFVCSHKIQIDFGHILTTPNTLNNVPAQPLDSWRTPHCICHNLQRFDSTGAAAVEICLIELARSVAFN